MTTSDRRAANHIATLTLLAAAALAAAGLAAAGPSYPGPAPMAQYRIERQADEVALARSAAPPSVSDAAQVLALGEHGYETAAKGTNGFVCIVERAWANEFTDSEFWNPKVRAPICFNPQAARSVLPTYLERTKWLLAGASKDQVLARTKAAIEGGAIGAPEIGSMCYMMSKDGYLGDTAGGHWHSHLMFFVPRTSGSPPNWGANLPGSPVLGGDAGLDPAAVYYVPVDKWSDGSASMIGM